MKAKENIIELKGCFYSGKEVQKRIDIAVRETKIEMNQQISERLTKLEVENRELKSQLKW